MKRLYSRLLISVLLFLVMTVSISILKKIPAWYGCTFSVFSSEESFDIEGFEWISSFDGKLYVGHKGKSMYLVTAGNFQGIECSVCMKHECTSSQFTSVLEKISSLPFKNEGTAKTINLKKYPDLSMYTNFVLSWEDRMNIWKVLELENEDELHRHSD